MFISLAGGNQTGSPVNETEVYEGPGSLLKNSQTLGMCLAPEVEYYIRQSRRKQVKKDKVITQLVASKGFWKASAESIVNRIYGEQIRTIQGFWKVELDEETGKRKLTIPLTDWMEFLKKAGFCKYWDGRKFSFARLRTNIAKKVKLEDLISYVDACLEELPFEFYGNAAGPDEEPEQSLVWRKDLQELYLQQSVKLLSDHQLSFLPDLPGKPLRDRADRAYFYYRNGWVEVTKFRFQFYSYHKLPGYIWEEQQVQPARDFHPLEYDSHISQSDFLQLCIKLMADTAKGSSVKRTMVLLSNLAILLHEHRSRSLPELIILNEEMSLSDSAGGVGKGIIVQAISKLRPVCILNGRDPELLKRFPFSRVTEFDRVVVFDDLDTNKISLEDLMPFQKEGLVIKRKYQLEQRIPFEYSPYILVTTKERLCDKLSIEESIVELPFKRYFNLCNTPATKFGKCLFDDWTTEEWSYFDNLIMFAMKRYLKGGIKRQLTERVDTNRLKLIQCTSKGFVKFMDDFLKDDTGKWKNLGQDFPTKVMHIAFPFASKSDEGIANNTFYKWLQEYAALSGLELVKKRKTDSGKTQTIVRFHLPNPATESL